MTGQQILIRLISQDDNYSLSKVLEQSVREEHTESSRPDKPTRTDEIPCVQIRPSTPPLNLQNHLRNHPRPFFVSYRPCTLLRYTEELRQGRLNLDDMRSDPRKVQQEGKFIWKNVKIDRLIHVNHILTVIENLFFTQWFEPKRKKESYRDGRALETTEHNKIVKVLGFRCRDLLLTLGKTFSQKVRGNFNLFFIETR